MSDDFNHSWLVLLAKGDHSGDDAVVARAAEDTRPVSLANSDSKICESALGRPLAEALSTWACADQRGFVEGRMLVDNIIEIDTYSRIAALTMEGSRASTNRPAMSFFDFAAAFPSVAWKFIWLCMKYIGLPKPYMKAFRKVYANNVHFLRFMGKVYRAYVAASGVKTGGTASGSIFVLCIGPFLQLLRSQAGLRDFGRAFADDIGYVVIDITVTFPAFVKAFHLFGLVSNVNLKIKKTVIVPLWTLDIFEAKSFIASIVPEWTGVKVALQAKYLGVYIGPRCADVAWSEPLIKYNYRDQTARTTGAGFLCSVFEYNVMCVTALNYVGQFYVRTSLVLATERRMLQRLTSCPRYTFSAQALWSLRALGMRQEFASVRACTTASMVRMATQTATTLKDMQALFGIALNDDRAPLTSTTSGDMHTFDAPAFVVTLQKAIECAFLPDVHRSAWGLFLRSLLHDLREQRLQSAITKFITPRTYDFSVVDYLSKRMSRWKPCVSKSGRGWWDICGAFALQLHTEDLHGSPVCVVASCLKTGLNSWASARRFGALHFGCIFGCGSGDDCIEHYLVCSVSSFAWDRIFRAEWGPFEYRLAFRWLILALHQKWHRDSLSEDSCGAYLDSFHLCGTSSSCV